MKYLQGTEQKNIKLMIGLDEIGAGRMKVYTLNTSKKLKNAINKLLIDPSSKYLVHNYYPLKITKDLSGLHLTRKEKWKKTKLNI